MSKIHNTVAALAATVALGAGSIAGATPAQAATCTSSPNVHCSMSYAKKISTSLAPGSRGHAVKNLQHALAQARFSTRITGVYDAQTVRSVKAYQASRKISATGTAGSQTLRALRLGMGAKAHLSSVTSSVHATATSSRAQAAVNYAYAHIGRPYVYGATGPSSFDCSGLTQAAWRSAGKSIPRTSTAQWRGLSSVSKSQLRPGDIVVFYGGGHVGLYVGNGKVIHAPRPGQSVKIASLSSMPFSGAVRP